MSRRPKVDQDARIVYVLLRYEAGQDQAGFSDLTSTSPGQVSLYDRGERTVPQEVLERAAGAVGFPIHLLRPARRAVRSFRVAARGWSRADRALAEALATDLLACAGEAVDMILSAGEAERRERAVTLTALPADTLWQRLERRNARQRLALVEEVEAFRTRELHELVSARSAGMERDDPDQARELAGLARRIAELCPEV